VNGRGEALSTSGLSYILKQHVRTATQRCPSLSKKRVSPHVMRHTCAMISLQATELVNVNETVGFMN